LARIAPGLCALLGYRFSDDFRHDAMAGLSVAAVALPVSIAYAQLAGFDPVVGLYSSILPLVAYAIFGTSRQLMVNPDAAASAVIAAAIAPLARNSAELYLSLTVALTFLTGVFCIVASYFPPRCAGRFPIQTNFGRISQWHRHQHLSRADRKAIGVLG
jgi:MFS superfamily sulfate permease-like transporter